MKSSRVCAKNGGLFGKSRAFFPQQPMFSHAEALDAPRVAAWASERGRLPAEHGGYFEGPGQRSSDSAPTWKSKRGAQQKTPPPHHRGGARATRSGEESCGGRRSVSARRAPQEPSAGQRGRAPGYGARRAAPQRFFPTTRAEMMRTSSSGRSLASVATCCILSITERPFTTSPNTVY